MTVEGTTRTWRLDPDADPDNFTGRTALLSPFDRLVHARDRAADLFDFEFGIELYKPRNTRRWGYYAMPVLHHDHLIGKLDVTADRDTGTLHINAIHQDRPWTTRIRHAVDTELQALADWLDLTTSDPLSEVSR